MTDTLEPRVKALEWTKRDGYGRWDCEHPLGEAWIKKYLGAENYTLYAPGFRGPENNFQTLEAAKQACQDHFASLITQCLEPGAPVVSEDEEWSSEIVPNRRNWGWIARVFLNGELDHERAFESLDAATEHAEHFAALTPTEGGE